MKPRTLLGTALVDHGLRRARGRNPGPVVHRTNARATATKPPAVQVDSQARSAAVDSAKEYVGEHRSLFRAASGDASSASRPRPGRAGTHYVAYERTHRGLPVVGGDFVLAVNDDGKVTGRTRRAGADDRPRLD